ncbi:peptidoglycan DD-metalloendopeptidase family protein [Halomonas sp. BLK-85]
MLRILHSLPRTHKLLLLPVATMVTVLGTQKLLTLYQGYQITDASSESVYLPLSENASPGLPSLNEEKTPVANAIDKASRAIDITRHSLVPPELQPMELADFNMIDSANATSQPDQDTQPVTALEDGALHIAVVLGTLTNGMLEAHSSPDQDDAVADATSYEDYDIDLIDTSSYLDFELAAEEPYVPEWQTHLVSSGETFAVVAQDVLSMGYSEVLTLLEAMPNPRLLTHWRSGQHFNYQLDEQGELLALKMMHNRRDGVLIERAEDQLDITVIERQGEPIQRLYAGTLSGSFARSAQSTGLGSDVVTDVTQLLEKKYDFRRDSRRGDNFQVLVESDMIDGQAFDSRVLAVRYEGERMDLTLVRNTSDDNFYTEEGNSLDPSFSRYPFQGSYRLSSHFNPRRKHPVTGRVSPHNGTDFAMPIGTPITAPANGRVDRVDYHNAAGRYVVIKHDNGYRTRYLHLSRSLVKPGERVEMGEEIALSGNTGRSTGPHLHYEVHVNNKPVNAMNIDLPENTGLSGNALLAFQRQAAPVLAALDSGETGNVSVATYAAEGDVE